MLNAPSPPKRTTHSRAAASRPGRPASAAITTAARPNDARMPWPAIHGVEDRKRQQADNDDAEGRRRRGMPSMARARTKRRHPQGTERDAAALKASHASRSHRCRAATMRRRLPPAGVRRSSMVSGLSVSIRPPKRPARSQWCECFRKKPRQLSLSDDRWPAKTDSWVPSVRVVVGSDRRAKKATALAAQAPPPARVPWLHWRRSCPATHIPAIEGEEGGDRKKAWTRLRLRTCNR